MSADDPGDWFARAVAAVSERAGDDLDVVHLVAAIGRPVRKALARGKRSGKSKRHPSTLAPSAISG
jgi:hypothetical protein